MWSWIGGNLTTNDFGFNATAPGQPSVLNRPPSRDGAPHWFDGTYIWVFSGRMVYKGGGWPTWALTEGLWRLKVDTLEWTFMPVSISPRARFRASFWIQQNQLWLFGGSSNAQNWEGKFVVIDKISRICYLK